MINANELRIGNWVKIVSPNDGFMKANPKLIFDILYESDGVKVQPVPITPEILGKCGFEKDNNDMENEDYCEWHQKDFPVIGELCSQSEYKYLFDTETDTLRIYYLHQLQNLYFALTNEELTISL